jgi:hypothetical protein
MDLPAFLLQHQQGAGHHKFDVIGMRDERKHAIFFCISASPPDKFRSLDGRN